MRFVKIQTGFLLLLLAGISHGLGQSWEIIPVDGDVCAAVDAVALSPGQFCESGRVYRESAGGTVLNYFSIDSQKATGWAIDYATGRGWDTYGLLNSDWSFRWSEQGAARIGAGCDSNFWTDPPYTIYSHVNQFGESGTGSLSFPSCPFRGSFYESFSDNGADNWITNRTSAWSIEKISEPGANVRNRVYSFTKSEDSGATTGWKDPVSLYSCTLSSSIGFVLRADVRNLASEQDSIGLAFCADNTSVDNGYLFMIGPDSCSLYKCVDGATAVLLETPLSSETRMERRGWNSLKVEMLNRDIKLFANGILIDRYTDSKAIPSGMVGIAGRSPASSGTFQWDNIACHRNLKGHAGKKSDLSRTDGTLQEHATTRPSHYVAQRSDLNRCTAPPNAIGNSGEFYSERAGGLFLEYFNINDGISTGWTISYMIDKGWDNFGSLKPDGKFRWSTSGRSRLQYGSEHDYLSPEPWKTYDYIDATGYAWCGGTIAAPEGRFRGSLYESFSDSLANGWLVDDSFNWSIAESVEPGTQIANRFYVGKDSHGQQKMISVFDYHYTASAGFTCSVDATSDAGSAGGKGLIFCARCVGAVDCYTFTVERDRYCLSKWIDSEKTVLIRDNSPHINVATAPRHVWNTLKVIMTSGSIDLYINDRWVDACFDETHTGGYLGVFGDVDSQMNRFDNFTCHRKTSKSTHNGQGG